MHVLPQLKSRLRLLAIGSTVALSLTLSATTGVPAADRLPQVALGWPLLLILERAAVMMTLAVLLFTFGLRLSRGELPLEVGNVVFGRLHRQQRMADQDVERRLLVLEVLAGLRPSSDLEAGPSGG